MNRQIAPWAAFLACCFLVVGLMGLFASYAVQTPMDRAVFRLGVLKEVRDAAGKPNADWPALRAKLADRAAAVLDGDGAIGPRVDAEAEAALEQGAAEASAVAFRVRLLLLVVTTMAGAFGIGILFISRRA